MATQASAQLLHPPGLEWLFASWKTGKFPKSVCTSVNECVCHGIPDSRPLQDGDVVNIDVTVYLNVSAAVHPLPMADWVLSLPLDLLGSECPSSGAISRLHPHPQAVSAAT